MGSCTCATAARKHLAALIMLCGVRFLLANTLLYVCSVCNGAGIMSVYIYSNGIHLLLGHCTCSLTMCLCCWIVE